MYNSGQLKWEDGIIGKLENYWMERFPVRRLFVRGLATAFVNLGCSELVIQNKIGDVLPITFLLAIDDVSSFKTPPLMGLRRLVVQLSRNLLDPAKFTVPGFVEHVCGRKKRKDMEATNPHPIGLILRDEISKLNAEKSQTGYGAILAFLCELWNGWIESASTRSYGLEGGIKTLHSMTATSNYHFLKTLEEDFWIIGVGSRASWVTKLEREGATEEWDEDFFFRKWDEEEEILYTEVIKMWRKINNKGKLYVVLDMQANHRWLEYDKQCRSETRKEKDEIIKTLMSKRGHLALRLVIPYTASVMRFEKGMMEINLEDINRAISDVEEQFVCGKMLVEKWRKTRAEKKEDRSKTSKYDLIEMMTWMVKVGGGYCSPTEIKGAFYLSNSKFIKDKLEIGSAKNPAWIEEYVPAGLLVDYLRLGTIKVGKIFERFKPKTGSSPAIYKITEEGKNVVKENI